MKHRSRAFTLVELLVVIGIIAVLIAILLPALSKTREIARRTQCLSSMRELSNAMRIYATRFKDAVPIGYMDQANFNYFVNWNNANGTKVSMMGLLSVAKLTPNPKAFYCPSVDDEQYKYNTPSNVWPDFDNWPNDPHFTTPGLGHTRITYMTRPLACWPSSSKPISSSNPRYEPDPRYWIPYLGTNWKISDPNKLVFGLPKFSKLKNKAILTDLIISKEYIWRTHKTGVNVLYANGSAQWLDLSEWITPSKPIPAAPSWSPQDIWKKWRSITESGAFSNPDVYNDFFLAEVEYNGGSSSGAVPASAMPVGIWVNFDRLSGQTMK